MQQLLFGEEFSGRSPNDGGLQVRCLDRSIHLWEQITQLRPLLSPHHFRSHLPWIKTLRPGVFGENDLVHFKHEVDVGHRPFAMGNANAGRCRRQMFRAVKVVTASTEQHAVLWGDQQRPLSPQNTLLDQDRAQVGIGLYLGLFQACDARSRK